MLLACTLLFMVAHIFVSAYGRVRLWGFLACDIYFVTSAPEPEPDCRAWRGYCCSKDWYCGTSDELKVWVANNPPPPVPCPYPGPGGKCPNTTEPGSGVCQYWPLARMCSFFLPENGNCHVVETWSSFVWFDRHALPSLHMASYSHDIMRVTILIGQVVVSHSLSL